MKTATLRTYRYKYDAVDRWRCPYCGAKQDHYEEELLAECFNCHKQVQLIYKVFRGNKGIQIK